MAKRANGEGSVYKRKSDGYWVAQLLLGHDLDGKRRYHTSYHKKQSEAREALKTAIIERDKGQLVPGAKRTLGEYLAGWIETVRPSLEAKTWVEYRRYVEKVLVPCLGDESLPKLQPMKVQRLYAQLLEEHSPRWVALCHAILHKALEDAVHWQLIPSNPADHVRKPKVPKRAFSIWSPEQIRLFLQDLQADPDLPLYFLAILTGCRAGELLALRWDAVDFERQTVTIQRSVTRVATMGLVVKDRTKSAAGQRLIAVPAVGFAALARQREQVQSWCSIAGDGWQENDLVFPKRDGGYRDDRAAREKLQRACVRLSLPDLRFHDLRHLHASLLLAQGVPAKTVQQRLGHSSIQVTMDVYGHLLPGADRAAADDLGAALNFGA